MTRWHRLWLGLFEAQRTLLEFSGLARRGGEPNVFAPVSAAPRVGEAPTWTQLLVAVAGAVALTAALSTVALLALLRRRDSRLWAPVPTIHDVVHTNAAW